MLVIFWRLDDFYRDVVVLNYFRYLRFAVFNAISRDNHMTSTRTNISVNSPSMQSASMTTTIR